MVIYSAYCPNLNFSVPVHTTDFYAEFYYCKKTVRAILFLGVDFFICKWYNPKRENLQTKYQLRIVLLPKTKSSAKVNAIPNPRKYIQPTSLNL